MRIIGGNNAGLRINPTKLKLRPTTDRSKEALFNILYNKVDYDNVSVLDLFSGTGNISYEFASRGAKSIYAIEKNNKSVEFYVNGTEKSNSLTLGTDYILYICLEGDAYNSSTYSSVAGRETFVDSGGNTKYRTGWFDCQLQASTSNITLQNGKGCFMASNSNVISGGTVEKYQFILYGAEINNGSDVNKIYYRLGIKNDSNQLSSSTYSDNSNPPNTINSIESISVEYSPEENQ